MSTIALWTMNKTVALTGGRRHLHRGAVVASGFTAPALVPSIYFGPIALAGAIARTATLLDAPSELLIHMRDSALAEAQILLANGPGFELSPLLTNLADSERTHFASRVGAGITDLYMNALGYVWRDNAACLATSLDPHADFLYHGGNALGYGVVLAEARGSFAAKVSDSSMAAAAERKYLRQVRPYIGVSSPHGQVIHGYSLAFGSRPGVPGAFLRLSQTLRTMPEPDPANAPVPTSAPTIQVPTTMALATHRSNFILMDAMPITGWIDWVSGSRDFPEDSEPVAFVRFDYAGRSFLASLDALAPYRSPFLWFDDLYEHPYWWRRWSRSVPSLQPFVMEETAAAAFLGALTDLIRNGSRDRPGTLELPAGDIVGFADGEASLRGRDAREGYDYALFRDGLALIAGLPRRQPTDLRIWDPKEGLS